MKYDWHCCEIYLQHRTILCFNHLVCLTCVFVQNGEQRSHHHPVHPSAAVLHLPAVRQPHAAGGRKTGVSRPDSGHPGLLQSDRYENTHTHVQTDPHFLILIYVCVCVCVSGYICEPHNNPADFFLDVINGESTAVALNKLNNSEGTAVSLLYECFLKIKADLQLSLVNNCLIFFYIIIQLIK